MTAPWSQAGSSAGQNADPEEEGKPEPAVLSSNTEVGLVDGLVQQEESGVITEAPGASAPVPAAEVVRTEAPPDPYAVLERQREADRLQAILDEERAARDARRLALSAPLGAGGAGTRDQASGVSSPTTSSTTLANLLAAPNPVPPQSTLQSTPGTAVPVRPVGGAALDAVTASLTAADVNGVGYAASPPVAPLSPFEVKKGAVIPAVLVTGITSDTARPDHRPDPRARL